MKKINFKEIFVPTISLFLICIVVAALLAGTNELTKGPIAEIEKETAAEAMKSVCPEAVSFIDMVSTDAEVYQGVDANGTSVGFAVSSSYKGYGGDIEIMVGIGINGEVTGVEILSHGETPGLGANCTKTEFTDMYKQPIPQDGFSVTKDGTGGESGKIDALTGATITSDAVTQAVNNAIDVCRNLGIRGGEN